MRIGNRSDALAAYEVACEGVPDSDFRSLSGGGCREVLALGDVVYKVQTDFEHYMRGYGNHIEYRHARTLRKASDNGWLGRVYIPRVTGYFVAGSTPVLAMEYMHGTKGVARNDLSPPEIDAVWQLFNLGFGDMHKHNFVWLNSRKAAVSPIDMGSRRHLSDGWANADTRCIWNTPYADQISKHRDFLWRNRDRQRGIPASCPCGCGMLRWDA